MGKASVGHREVDERITEKRTAVQWSFRIFFYVMGMLLLAMGISMNTMTNLGVSPIVTVPYNISVIWNLNFGNTTLAVYIVFVIMQFVLKGRKAFPYDLLQIPLSIIFTRFLNLFQDRFWITCHNFQEQILLLILALILTGVGLSMSVSMRLVPNPGDGIVAAMGEKIHKNMGFSKNLFDFFSIMISLVIGPLFGGKLIGIGLGTVAAVIGVGRVVAIFQHFCQKPLLQAAGMKP